MSNREPSATTISALPCVHNTGGFESMPTMPDQLQYFPESAFMMPPVPGAIPGQFAEGMEPPG